MIRDENTSIRDMFTRYVLILALIPAVAGLLGFMFSGLYIKGERFDLHPGSVILWSVLSYVTDVIIVFCGGYIIDAFSRTFRTGNDLNASMKVIVYSFTPVWLSGIFYLIPQVNFISIAGWIFSIVLMYTGLKIVKLVPGERVIGYEVLVFCVLVIISYFSNLIITGLAFGNLLGRQ